MGHHFISYSAVEAEDFAVQLRNHLAAGMPAWAVWLDKRELRPGLDWDEQIGEAIKTCDSLLFVMTRDSVRPNSVCKREWTLALKHNKPVIPLKLHLDAELPFRLEPREYIDFSGGLEPGLTRLRGHLRWLSEPAGVLQGLKDRLAQATRDLPRLPERDRPRVMAEIAALERQLADQQKVVDDPGATVRVPMRRSDDRRIDRRKQGEGSAPPAAEATEKTPQAWDPAMLERARRDLAVYIGPMARVIVNRAAERALSVEDLYGTLAAEIVSPDDRRKFLASRPL
jgi:hypothetical protein